MEQALADTLRTLRERVQALLRDQRQSHPSRRILIALAGVPGSGKSTIAAALLDDLKNHAVENAAILPMDGFHYSRAVLSSFDDPVSAIRLRGSPFTFDAAAFVDLVRQVKRVPVTRGDEPAVIIRAPGFDHAVQDPVPDAVTLSSRIEVVIIEGNYTLLDEEPWNGIANLVDDRWFVDVPAEVARQRLAARHLQCGIEQTLALALLRADENDVPNGARIRSNLVKSKILIVNQ